MSLLVLGKTGQVALELAHLAPEATFLSRAEADLSDPARCAAAIDRHAPSAIINAAAYTAVDRAETEPDLAHRVNAEAPAHIAQTAAARGIPLVHISTDYVFDGTGSTPFAPDAPTAPMSVYGRTKLAGEDAVHGAGGVHAILRTSWVFSAHGNNFVKTMLRLGATRDSLTVVSDQIGGPTPAADIARACLTVAQALTQAPALSGTYHFGGTPAVSWADFARAIMAGAALPCTITDIPSTDYPTLAPRPGNSRLDCRTITQNFGIECPDWRRGLDRVLSELNTQGSAT